MSALRHNFRSRDFFIHDGAAMRRVHLSSRTQVAGVTAGAVVGALSLCAVAEIALSTPAVAGSIGTSMSRDAAVVGMNARVAAMEAEMASIRVQAAEHARRLELRQAALDAMVTGKGAVPVPASLIEGASVATPLLTAVMAPLNSVETRQNRLAARLAAATDAKYQLTTKTLGHLGLDPRRFHRVAGAMGGPYEPMPSASGNGVQSDTQFRALFQSWKRLEQLQQGIVAIPSQRPVQSMTFTSGFGVRSDPFRGSAAMHAGVDMPGPTGTPIYATADGVVNRAQWVNGYGNLVEIDHGKGIQTRYGHLSAFVVAPGTHVTRGQLIARMGSTGRSTGSHLHYEVRLDGHAVNPMPFLQTGRYFAAMQPVAATGAMGGPGAD